MNDLTLFKTSPLPAGFVCTPTEEALAQRQTLLDIAGQITRCTTPEENEIITQCGSAMQKMLKTAKKDGLELRRPLNFIADIIKTAEDNFLAPLLPHMARLGQFATVYRQEEERKAEEARQKRAEEISQMQAIEAREREAARQAQEKGDFTTGLIRDMQADNLRAATEVAIAQPPPEAAKIRGQSFTAKKLGVEVLDSIALWNARPELCNPPTAKLSAINAICTPENPVPGLRLWWEAKVSWKTR